MAATRAATEVGSPLLQRIEIVGDRRRVHDAAFRGAVVAASRASGARVQELAERHGICPGLVYRWRRAAAAMTAGDRGLRLVPVRIAAEPGPASAQRPRRMSPSSTPAPPPFGVIEIELAGGVRVRVDETVSLPALRRVLAVLRG